LKQEEGRERKTSEIESKSFIFFHLFSFLDVMNKSELDENSFTFNEGKVLFFEIWKEKKVLKVQQTSSDFCLRFPGDF
jgi:hypothetical protein